MSSTAARTYTVIKAEIEFNAGAQKRRESYSVTLHPARELQKAGADRSGKNSSRLERNISLINACTKSSSPRFHETLMCLHGGSINRLPGSLIASKGVIKNVPERFSFNFFFFFLVFRLLFIITFFSTGINSLSPTE